MYFVQRALVFVGLLAVIVALALFGWWLPVNDAVPILGAILYILTLPYLQGIFYEEGE